MNKTSIVLGITTLVVGGLVLAPKAALAYRGDPGVKGPNYTAERHEAMTKAFETNDYNAWKNLMTGKGRVIEVINANNFSRFAEAHKLALEGKTNEAKAIRSELGLGMGMGHGRTR